MKCFLILTLAVAAVVCEEHYKEHDNFDIDALTNSPEQLKAFTGCFIEKTTCDAVSGEFKKNIKEAVVQGCAKCSAPQKVMMGKFLEGLKKNAPAEYQAFKAHFDPENKYLDALQHA